MSATHAWLASPVHVVAAVLRDARGRLLLSQRRAGQDMPGLWEFPGGKRDADESSFAALQRELTEELGITAHAMKPLIELAHAYPHKRIVLEALEVSAWTGVPSGREGQAIQWVDPSDLAGLAMPPADRPIVAAITQADRYLISPNLIAPDLVNRFTFMQAMERALVGGIRRVQLRTPTLAAADMRAIAVEVSALCAEHGADLLLNSACSNAFPLVSDLGCGLHLTSRDLARIGDDHVPIHTLLATSCHSAEELQKAERLGCNFAVLGPVAATASHPDVLPIGWSGFRAMRESASLPIYALGGMQSDDIAIARRNGAQGIAAIRGLWSSDF